MQFKNLTPHEITILSESGVTQDPQRKTFSAKSDEIDILRRIPPEGDELPRVEFGRELTVEIDGIKVDQVVEENTITGLPPEQDGIYLIVSGLVAATASQLGRNDCVAPNKLVRDADNPSAILGCLSLRKA